MGEINPRPNTNLSSSIRRLIKSQTSLPSLQVVQGIIYEEAKEELQFPESLKTFSKMGLDANLASAINVFEMMIRRIDTKITAPEIASEEDKKRAEALDNNLHHLSRPWKEYLNEATSILQFGFCTLEKVFSNQVYKDLEYIGWRHFPVISQNSVANWYLDDRTGELKGLKQNISGLNTLIPATGKSMEKDIPRKKFILFRNNPKRDNPEGNSPLKSCYLTWKYLSVIEEFEAIGIAKDVGGIAVFSIDQEYLKVADEDPESFQAKNLEQLERYAASITAGDQSYLMMPMAYNDQGKPLFDFKLQGIEGGGKQYKTSDIVTRHSNKLLMSFFADVLKLGAESQGSYALADSKTSLLAMAIESILDNISTTLNHDLIRQTYELNDWDYDPKTAARFEFGDLEKTDIAEFAKAVQNVIAVGGIRTTTDVEDKIREVVFDLKPMAEADPEILDTPNNSRSGDGLKDGLNNGVGTSTSKGGDRSTGNSNNK